MSWLPRSSCWSWVAIAPACGSSTRTPPSPWTNPPVTTGLDLEGAFPNPAVGALSIAFALPNGGQARLEVFDLAGRKVAAREVGGLGAGRHVVRLAEPGALESGIYLAKLTRGAETRTTKVAVLR